MCSMDFCKNIPQLPFLSPCILCDLKSNTSTTNFIYLHYLFTNHLTAITENCGCLNSLVYHSPYIAMYYIGQKFGGRIVWQILSDCQTLFIKFCFEKACDSTRFQLKTQQMRTCEG